MQATEFKERYTPEEYLALEEKAEFKSEYHNGEIIPVTGGSLNHNEIITNLWLLKSRLRGKGFRFYSSDVRLWIARHRKFVYPDVMVIQGEPLLYETRTDTVLNPKMIIEVLSKSTAEYDQDEKFRDYRSIPDLQEYVLINQYQIEIQQYTKTNDGFWIYRVYESVEDTLKFGSIDAEMSVAKIYEGVTFESSDSD